MRAAGVAPVRAGEYFNVVFSIPSTGIYSHQVASAGETQTDVFIIVRASAIVAMVMLPITRLVETAVI